MSEGTDGGSPENKRRHAGGELVIPVAGLLFAIYYISTILGTPWTAQVSAFFVGAILISLIVAFFIKTALACIAGEADLALGNLIEPVSFLPKRIILFGLTIGYIVVIHYLGFTLTTFIFLAASMALLSDGRRIGFIFLLSAIVSLVGWALFILAFDTRFPSGPFEVLMEALI